MADLYMTKNTFPKKKKNRDCQRSGKSFTLIHGAIFETVFTHFTFIQNTHFRKKCDDQEKKKTSNPVFFWSVLCLFFVFLFVLKLFPFYGWFRPFGFVFSPLAFLFF